MTWIGFGEDLSRKGRKERNEVDHESVSEVMRWTCDGITKVIVAVLCLSGGKENALLVSCAMD